RCATQALAFGRFTRRAPTPPWPKPCPLAGPTHTHGGKIEDLGAVHNEHPPMIAVVQVSPTVAHADPFPRAGLMLREQRQQDRRGEPQAHPHACRLLGDNHRPDRTIGRIADGVAIDHPDQYFPWLRLPGWGPVIPVRALVMSVPHQLGSFLLGGGLWHSLDRWRARSTCPNPSSPTRRRSLTGE